MFAWSADDRRDTGKPQTHIALTVSPKLGISIGIDDDTRISLWIDADLRAGHSESSSSFGGEPLLRPKAAVLEAVAGAEGGADAAVDGIAGWSARFYLIRSYY